MAGETISRQRLIVIATSTLRGIDIRPVLAFAKVRDRIAAMQAVQNTIAADKSNIINMIQSKHEHVIVAKSCEV